MKNNELLNDDITTLIKKIAIPSSVGMFFNTMYNIVDTFYVGSISTVAITALSYSFVIFFMLFSIGFGLSSAMTAHVGNSLGNHKNFLAKIFTTNGMTFVFLVSNILSFLGFVFLEDILTLIGASDKALVLSYQYTYVVLYSTVPMLLGLGANAVLVAKGDTKSYRNTLIFAFFLNLILDPLFMYGYGFVPAFGFIGVAYATVLIHFITFFYIMFKLYRTGLFDFTMMKLFVPDIRIYKKLTIQAMPMSINMFVMSIGTMIVLYFISFYGYKTVAAFGIGYRVEQIILLPILGLNTAVSSIVANNFGAKNYDRITQVMQKALKYGYIMCFVGMFVLVIFGKYIIMLFDNDMEVVNISYTYIVVESFIFFAFTTLFISISTLQGIKQPFIVPYVSVYRQLIMPYICLYILVEIYFVNILIVWIVMALITYSSAIWLYIYTKKKLNTIEKYS